MSKSTTKPFVRAVTPFLWLDGKAEDAAKAYTSLFADSRIVEVTRAGGGVQSATIVLAGQRYILFNGGPHYKLTPAFSLLVYCDTQEEIDYYWDKLSEGGTEVQCGWLTDKFGLSWQLVPKVFTKLISSGDAERTNRVMQALFGMKKIIIADLQRAYDGN